MSQDKPTVPFSPPVSQVLSGSQPAPYLHPAIATSPEAIAAQTYENQARARAAQRGLPKYTAERPGPGPAMPPLEAQHQGGMTIEQQAGIHGARPEQRVAQTTAAAAGSIVDGAPQQGFSLGSMQGAPGARQTQRTPAQLGILGSDTLPREAQDDPNYHHGAGSALATNQPHMAMKYGVIRNGMHISAQALQANQGPSSSGPQGARPITETMRDLQRLSSAVAPPTSLPQTDEEAEAQASNMSSSASQRAGRPPEAPQSPEEQKAQDARVQDAIQKLDDFDYDALRKQLQRDEINSPEQRAIIEERLQPLSLDELILRDRVTQTIPIQPGVFWVTFQSMTGDDDLALKRLLMAETKSIEVTERYLLDKFSIMSLAAGLTSINNNPVPSHLDKDGNFNDDLFWLKFGWVLKRGIHMLASIGANHTWFELRVRRLFVVERVKNG